MSDLKQVLNKARNGLRLTFEEVDLLSKVKGPELSRLFTVSREITSNKIGDKIFFYEKTFPPISLTGYSCNLNCKHCSGHYLKHMIPIKKHGDLFKVCKALYMQGVKGVLLSGGSRKDGTVPLDIFLDEIKKIKNNFNIFLEAHTGPIKSKISQQLATAKIDAVLPDIVGDVRTTEKIYGIKLAPKDYELMLMGMEKAGIKNISPHICVGLNNGQLQGEIEALKIVSKFHPTTIVITVFIPTAGTPMENLSPPTPTNIGKIIAIANLMFPKVPISLGCVRPGKKYRQQIDRVAIKAGVAKLAVPSRAAVEEAEKFDLKAEIFKQNMCCCVNTG